MCHNNNVGDGSDVVDMFWLTDFGWEMMEGETDEE